MEDKRRAIFRADAMRRFGEARDRTVLPRFASPRVVAGLWLLIALFPAGGMLAWLARIPVYASGSAVVFDRQAASRFARDGTIVAAFFPPETLSRLRAGQPLLLQLKSGERLHSQVFYVEPQVNSPAGVRQRFAIGEEVAAMVASQPSAVVLAKLETPQNALSPDAYAGSVGRAEVETGTRRVISLLPLVGRFFGD
jgi:hypothetical protein